MIRMRHKRTCHEPACFERERLLASCVMSVNDRREVWKVEKGQEHEQRPPAVRRRTVLLGAAAGAGAVALGAGIAPAQAQAAAFVRGADISWMPQMEAHGYYWNNPAGVRQDLFTILKGYGIT